MKPVLSPEEATALDRAAQQQGVAVELLMERAGRAVARACRDLLGGVYGRRVLVVVGKGNNGGDGLVAARHLSVWGARVSVLAVEPLVDPREPTATHLRRLAEEAGLEPRAVTAAGLAREVSRADLVVDAIFGTGFRGVPDDVWAETIETVDRSRAPVVSVDIPSGVNGLTGAVDGVAVHADLTVTFGAAKIGAVVLPGASYAGDLRVADIGFPEGTLSPTTWVSEPADVVGAMPVRPVDSHKRASGVLVVVAGSRGMTGAVRLIAGAAGRIGAGLVVVAVPQGILPVVQSSIVEATFLPLPETAAGTISPAALAPVLEALGRAHALAVGPGLTTNEETGTFIRDLVRSAPVPIVLDADGLNAFAGRPADLRSRKAPLVITPHAGEFERLTGISPRHLAEDRLRFTRLLAGDTRAVAVLKGSRTIVADPDGTATVNPTGGPVLATAGTGDVLTGTIGGLLARGVGPFEAAAAGVYVHGVAGTLAGRAGAEGTLAGDVVESLPGAVAEIRRQATA
jgi:NAD(P)H-hydrate epimerase